ncbi:uncharacterized protein LOC104582522 [Brachypodium distachyon]|uniref:Uncharacterized protein n=1 Tax=Brachypodium distachyon TaxID=15368 RepID=I1HDC7_BRADI|nr:uncharacterized protein LOC104582522 [Brachypodium distachyon]KQK03335.1 hypothetical protein BRADI_2g07180v3 [Brachypodium distachyon]|eukprot:XP_010230634.1 uncharacterized protein LOC104582522 [Brachypodium distachyon]
MARASAAVVLFALLCCLLVDLYPARRPGELPPQVITAAHDPVGDPREASAEPLLPTKLVALEEVDPVRRAPQVFQCGGEDVAAAVTASSSSEEGAQPRPESGAEEEAGIMGWFRGSDTDCDDSGSDTDCDSDSDDEHDGGWIMGWFWRLARRF